MHLEKFIVILFRAFRGGSSNIGRLPVRYDITFSQPSFLLGKLAQYFATNDRADNLDTMLYASFDQSGIHADAKILTVGGWIATQSE